MTTLDEQFTVAVKVVQNLPKTGPFKPSIELRLRFYSYFKQATEGPCRLTQPPFWDLIGKTKWKVWSDLGELSQKEAKQLYVAELKKALDSIPPPEEHYHFFQPFFEVCRC
ncbi:acyl-CoA-binding domain-containing protein 4-like [Tachypleus tridentatus]|uniref:acyl-CoA-binding domain-containing protein 4-like n=1 Tax=Tachypleus tridentatus TaxID=6853 RepID=UPI003FD48C25